MKQHQGKQQGVPIARSHDTKLLPASQRRPKPGKRRTSCAPVVGRQQPVVSRQVEDRDRARSEAAVRLFQGTGRFDPAMTEDVEGEIAAERAAAERHFVDRTRHHRPARLGRGKRRRKGVVFQPDRASAGHRGAQFQQHAAGAAARVEHGTCRRRIGQRPDEKLRGKRAQAAIPPHAVLDRVHALVFSPLHAAPAPAKCLLPTRL
jgi:hypothetical protein